MNIILLIIVVFLFLYLNIKINCKINLTAYFFDFNILVFIFKTPYKFSKRIYFNVIIKKITYRYKKNEKSLEKYKKYLHYSKYIKYLFKIFLIKDILIYPNCCENLSSFALEFNVVNKLFRRSILNG